MSEFDAEADSLEVASLLGKSSYRVRDSIDVVFLFLIRRELVVSFDWLLVIG